MYVKPLFLLHFSFSLHKKGVSTLDPSLLSQMTNLGELDLSDNSLKKLDTKGVCLKSLSKINLANNQLTTLEGFDCFPNLKELNISNNPLIEVSY